VLIAWTGTLRAVEMSDQVAPERDQLLVAFLAKRTLVPFFVVGLFGCRVARFFKFRKRAVVESAEGVLLLFCVLLPVREK